MIAEIVISGVVGAVIGFLIVKGIQNYSLGRIKKNAVKKIKKQPYKIYEEGDLVNILEEKKDES